MKREFICIEGGHRLVGVTSVSGNKNAALACIPATLLSDEPVVLENIPKIDDVRVTCSIIEDLGGHVVFEGHDLRIDPRGVARYRCSDELARRIRASIYYLGVLLGRFGRVQVAMPGGDEIGARPIDQTIKGLSALGADIESAGDVLRAATPGMRGAEVFMDISSVGATINTMLAAVKAPGYTTIFNAAKEPHVVDLANMLNSMGASIKGAGTSAIRIQGVNRLHGSTYAIIPDQIETGTLMIMAAASRGDVVIQGAIPFHMEALTAKLLEMGAHVEEGDDSIRVYSTGEHRHINVKTLPYPGFPTDLQQPISALLTTARGTSVITDTIFEQRFKHLDEIRRMGAQAQIADRTAIITGVPRLTGCRVQAGDLRAGVSLITAGLMAEGVSWVGGVHQIDRGYERIEEKLSALGAKARRVIADE